MSSDVPTGAIRLLARVAVFAALFGPPAVRAEGVPEQALPADGSRLEKRITPGEVHRYLLLAEAGEFCHVAFEQRGADITVKLVGPDARTLLEADQGRRPYGREWLVFLTESAGTHTVEVRLSAGGRSGTYTVGLAERRSARATDRVLAQAEERAVLASGLSQRPDPAASREAARHFEAAAGLFHQIGEARREALALYRAGQVVSRQGNLAQAIEHDRSALVLLRALEPPDPDLQALVLLSLAVDCRRSGQIDEGLAAAREAGLLVDRMSEPGGKVVALNRLALFYSVVDPQRSRDLYADTLALARRLDDRDAIRTALLSLSAMSGGRGDFQGEFDLLRSLLSETPPEARGTRRVILDNMGVAHHQLGQFEEARQRFGEALELAVQMGDALSEHRTRFEIGIVLASLGRHQEATESFEMARTGFEKIGYAEDRAALDAKLGLSYAALGDREKARVQFGLAVGHARKIGDLSSESEALCGLAELDASQGALEEARRHASSAMEVIESLRAQVQSRWLGTAYADVQPCYELHVDILMRLHRVAPDAGHDVEALRVSERGRARMLLESLGKPDHAVPPEGIEAGLGERERALRQRLNARLEHQATLLADGNAEKAAGLEGEINALLTELGTVEDQILGRSPTDAGRTRPRIASLEEIQARLPADARLLEYSLGTERSYVWVVSGASVRAYPLPARREIEEQARGFYESLTARNRRVRFETEQERRARISRADRGLPLLAVALGEMVVGPFQKEIEGQRLVVVADGALHYVPFGALMLRDAERGKPRYLVSSHEIVQAPSGSVLAALARAERAAPNRTLAVVADPVFGRTDERFPAGAKGKLDAPRPPDATVSALLRALPETGRASGDSLPRLPFAGREARGILALVRGHERQAFLGFEASREAIGPHLGRCRYVHFATHGFVNDRSPDRSGLLLSLLDREGRERAGFLSAGDIRRLRLSADLVTLSSCSSGLGKQIRGEGLVGLTQSFLHAGAKRVLVTLWSIQDDSTADLMASLYQGMLGKGLAPAAALRAAQLKALREGRWSAPYYWAAFVLQGSF